MEDKYRWGSRQDDPDRPYVEIQKGDFHVGQSYEDTPAKTVVCRRCKADKFMVGKGSYFTAIKCLNCGWEVCIHDG